MPAERRLSKSDLDGLVEIWKVLEALTVSMSRIGHVESTHGEEAAKNALSQFMGPAVFRRIARARDQLVALLEEADPELGLRLDKLAEDESDIGYWGGPA